MMNNRIRKTVYQLVDELDLRPPVDLNRFFDYFSNLKIKYNVDDADLLMRKISKENDDYVISLSCEKENMSEKDRFELACELGHIFLGHVDRHEMLYRRRACNLEYEATEFAEELLMPREEFIKAINDNVNSDGTCDILSLAKYFGVSSVLATNRGKQLGFFDRWQ